VLFDTQTHWLQSVALLTREVAQTASPWQDKTENWASLSLYVDINIPLVASGLLFFLSFIQSF